MVYYKTRQHKSRELFEMPKQKKNYKKMENVNLLAGVFHFLYIRDFF